MHVQQDHEQEFLKKYFSFVLFERRKSGSLIPESAP